MNKREVIVRFREVLVLDSPSTKCATCILHPAVNKVAVVKHSKFKSEEPKSPNLHPENLS